MTSKEKAWTLYTILKCSPATESLPRFKDYAETGDADGLWRYYSECLNVHPGKDIEIEAKGLISFRALQKAMSAINDLKARG